MVGSKERVTIVIIFAAIFLLAAVFLLWIHNSTDLLSEKVKNIRNTNQISEHNCTKIEQEARFCSLEYFPVCDNTEKSYSNGCWACASGAINWTSGEC
jgi:hypothetical protein